MADDVRDDGNGDEPLVRPIPAGRPWVQSLIIRWREEARTIRQEVQEREQEEQNQLIAQFKEELQTARLEREEAHTQQRKAEQDQRKADQEQRKAERKADQDQRKAERKAEEDQRKAERKAEEDQWQQRLNRMNTQQQQANDNMMEKWRLHFNMMLQPTTTMTAQILTTSHSKNNTSHSKNNTSSSRHENDYNESASIKSASSNADHATNTASKQAKQYKSTTFDTTTTNAELMTLPNQDKENSYYILVSLGTTRPMPKKYKNPIKSTPTVKRILAADADQHLRANDYPTSTSILAHTRPDPLTTNELVNELRPLSRLRPLRP